MRTGGMDHILHDIVIIECVALLRELCGRSPWSQRFKIFDSANENLKSRSSPRTSAEHAEVTKSELASVSSQKKRAARAAQ